MIDPHVHLRDWAQANKETLAHGFAVAWRAGIAGLLEMPNTDPPLTTRRAIVRRIGDADRARSRLGIPIFHGIHGGLTAHEGQLAELVATYRELFPRVVGFKLFAGHSTGNMGIVTRDQQASVWQTLVHLDYHGVVTVHAETEALLHPHRWDPTAPISHGAARPVEAEVHSVRQQIELALEAGFRGSLHIAHITTPEVLDIIERNRRALPFALRGGVTPHHALLDESAALHSTVPEWKVNPPLRLAAIRDQLWDRVQAGAIDWIESDHAPHTWQDKIAGAAGLPGIPAFRMVRDRLRDTLPEQEVERLTHTAAMEAFQLPAGSLPDNPHADAPWDYSQATVEYPWDPYRILRL